MYKNYFYLFRAVIELNSLIKDKSILECFSQEKDKLFFKIKLDIENDLFLIVDTNYHNFSLLLKNNFKKAKKNVISFFDDFLPSKISNIKIAFGERIIKFELELGDLIFTVRGNKSNCFFFNQNEILPFKKTDRNDLLNLKVELSNLNFINTFDEFNKLINFYTFEQINNSPFITKEIKKELSDSNNYFEKLKNIVNDILFGKISVGINNSENVLIFSPLSLIKKNNDIEVELFDSYFIALENLFKIEFKTHSYYSLKNEIEKHVNQKLEFLFNKLNNLNARIETGSKENEYKHYGDLLLTNLNLINKGMNEILILDWNTNNQIKIKLDPKLTPQQNVDYYYEKSRSEKLAFEKSKQIFNETKDLYQKYLSISKELENELSFERLNEIKIELKISRIQKMTEEKEKLPFRHFIIQDKYHFFIGKDSKSNDLLTTKFAKQNDFWFHARSVAGSHGVLRVENSKEAIPKNILEKAASITAFYSKAKTSKLAPVTYTYKKYVIKNSKHEPGQVTVLKENVLIVNPEIPKDCIYVED